MTFIRLFHPIHQYIRYVLSLFSLIKKYDLEKKNYTLLNNLCEDCIQSKLTLKTNFEESWLLLKRLGYAIFSHLSKPFFKFVPL